MASLSDEERKRIFDIMMEAEREYQEKRNKGGLDLIKEGNKLTTAWTQWAYTKPPKNPLEFLVWIYVQFQQIALSSMTFPAAIGAFLLEEAAQSMGMGAYILWTAKRYEQLDSYLPFYKEFLDTSAISAKYLAISNPIAGGAVMIYLGAAKSSLLAFKDANDAKLLEELAKEENRQRLEDEALKYGSLVIRSSPTNAEIWINGINTEYLTPETFKRMKREVYDIELRKYSTKREEWDIYTFEAGVTPGRKKEMFIHIPKAVTSEEETPDQVDEDDTAQLPDFIKAEVTGDYAVDGDTFQTTAGERIRILGIDTPELERPWADMAKEYTYSLIEDKKIQLRIQTHLPIDTYGRTLAICESYKGNIAILLLSAGLARAFIAEDARYDPTRYLEAERVAKSRRIGIWSEMP